MHMFSYRIINVSYLVECIFLIYAHLGVSIQRFFFFFMRYTKISWMETANEFDKMFKYFLYPLELIDI